MHTHIPFFAMAKNGLLPLSLAAKQIQNWSRPCVGTPFNLSRDRRLRRVEGLHLATITVREPYLSRFIGERTYTSAHYLSWVVRCLRKGIPEHRRAHRPEYSGGALIIRYVLRPHNPFLLYLGPIFLFWAQNNKLALATHSRLAPLATQFE